MKPSEKIDFQNVEELTRKIIAQKITPQRFSLEVTAKEAVNAVQAAMSAEVAFRKKELILDDATKTHIQQVAKWLTDKEGKMGLLMLGLCGNGKTTLMRSIARLVEYVTEATSGYSSRTTMHVYSAKEIARMCVSSENEREEFRKLSSVKMLGIDDLGEEPKEIMNYGMIFTPLTDLILERYNRQLTTIVTTNLTKKQLIEKYGSRVYDRFKEMFEVIPFTNVSYRK